jgi:hypothetical protein
MRKNPSPKDQLDDDLKMLGVTFGLYLISSWLGYYALSILSAVTMDVIAFQAGITFHEVYSKPIHINQLEELDSSMEVDEPDTPLVEREQGVPASRCVTDEQMLNEQFKQVVDETNLRNRKRAVSRTPSSSTFVEDMFDKEPVPNFSQSHYLHNYMEELD